MALPQDGTLLELRVTFNTKRAVQDFEKQQRAAFKRVAEARAEGERKAARQGLETAQEFERRKRRFEILAIEDAHKREVAFINARFEQEKRLIRLLLKERIAAGELSAARAEEEYEQVERNLRRFRDRQLREAPARVAQDRFNRRGERPRSIAGAAFTGGAVGAIAADLGRDALFATRDAARELFDLGTAAQETAAKFGEVFGPAVGEANRFVNEFANDAGFTRSELQELTASVGALVQGMGFTQEASAGLSEEVVRLAADLASFNNVQGGAEDVGRRIIQALTGETEAIKAVNIVLRQEEVVRRALLDTGKETAKELTKQERALATLAVITEQAGSANGDLARTQDSTANRVRKLSAELREQREELAIRLIPTFDLVLDVLDAFLSGTEVATGGLVDFVANGVFETVAGLVQLIAELGTTSQLLLQVGASFGGAEIEGLGFGQFLRDLRGEIAAVNAFLDGSVRAFLRVRIGLNDLRATLLEFGQQDDLAQISRDRAGNLRKDLEDLQQEAEIREAEAEAREAQIAARRAELQALIDGSGELAANLRARAQELLAGLEAARALGQSRDGTERSAANPEREAERARNAAVSLADERRTLETALIEDARQRRLAEIADAFEADRARIEETARLALAAQDLTADARRQIQADERAALDALTAQRRRAEADVAAERRRAIEAAEQAAEGFRGRVTEAEDRERLENIEDPYERRVALAVFERDATVRAAEDAARIKQELAEAEVTDAAERAARLVTIDAELNAVRVEANAEAAREIKAVNLAKYDDLYRAAEDYTRSIVDAFERAFTAERRLSETDVRRTREDFSVREQDLATSLRARQITLAEYETERKRLTEDRAAFEREVEEDRRGAIVRLSEEVTGFLREEGKRQLVAFIARKATELQVEAATETGKTAVAEAGSAARIVASGAEVAASLVSAGASVVEAIAKFIASIPLPFPLNLVAAAAIPPTVIGLFNGAKSALGFASGGVVGQDASPRIGAPVLQRALVYEASGFASGGPVQILPQGGGYTGRGNRFDSAGLGLVEYHRGEVVMEKPIVDGQLREWMTLRALAQKGVRIADLLHAAGFQGFASGGAVDMGSFAPVVVPPVRQSGGATVDELSGIRAQLESRERALAELSKQTERAARAAEKAAKVAADTRANPPDVVFTRKDAGKIGRLSGEYVRGSTQRVGRPNTRPNSGHPPRQ